MQVTLDVSEQVAERLASQPGDLDEIIASGLRLRNWVGASSIAAEVINFLASGPSARDIVAFHASALASERSRALLQKNRENALEPADKAELEEIALLDHFMTLVKARAFEGN
jgi:hypothetical protein